MFGRNIIASVATLLLSAPVFAAEYKPVYLELAGEAEFEVIYHRALSNATGAALAGLIGAGIQSGIEAGADKAKTQKLRPFISKEGWQTQFLDTLNNKLSAGGYEAIWVDDIKDAEEGFAVTIYPGAYGFTLVNSSTQMLSAFIAFKASINNDRREKPRRPEKDGFYLTHKNQHTYPDLLAQNDLIEPELESVLQKAAVRLANKIIYSARESVR